MQNAGPVGSSLANRKIDEFLSRLASAPSSALLLDYDGTLAPFNCNPARAYPYPGISDALHLIRRQTGTRLVVVTGRPASEIPTLLNVSGIEVWGCHGLERLRSDGTSEIVRVDARLLAAIETAGHLISCEGFFNLAERKIASIAVHWRGKEYMAENITRRMRHVWSLIPDRSDLRFAPFDGGIEIRVAHIDKGDAVRTVFRDMGPDVAVAYLGDDVTDEDAFGALTHRGLNVLVRKQCRPTLADVWIKPPSGLLEFFRRWITACRESRTSKRGADA